MFASLYYSSENYKMGDFKPFENRTNYMPLRVFNYLAVIELERLLN